MKKLALIGILIFTMIDLRATEGSRIIGARSTGIGGVATTLSDLWSAYNNQAGLASLTNIQAGLAYESRFSLGELSVRSLAVAIPTKSGTFGFVASTFGFTDFSESKYGISYGRKLAENIALGAQINYQNIRLSNIYGNWSKVSGEIGLQANITTELMLAVHIANPIRLRLTEEPDEILPSVLRIGSSYKFSDKVFATMEAEKVLNLDGNFKAGVEYLITEKVALRGGVGTGEVRSNFGFGIKSKQFQFDAAVWYHQILGFSPSLSLNYQFPSKEK